MTIRLPTLVLAALLMAGCAGRHVREPVPEAVTPLAVAVETPHSHAADNLNATLWTQRAIEHDLIYREVYRAATQHLLAALADPAWDALPREERTQSLDGLAPAVILDIDETVLDNSAYQARLVRTGQAYDEVTWSNWVREEAAPASPGALEYTRFAADHGIAVIYISNRDRSLDEATLNNLRKLGFPVSGPEAFLGLGVVFPGCEQQGTEKGCRRQLVAQKYRVLAQVGDQIGDFTDIIANTADGRAAAVEPYLDWIGERWFVLPNPTYGSWEPATFDNDWSLPEDQRHQRKVNALRVE